MNTNYDALETRSQKMTKELVEAISHVLACDIVLVDAEKAWDNAYYDWCANVEGTLEAPGGGRWNDSKRRFAVSELYPVLVKNQDVAKNNMKGAETTLKLVNAEISGLNRSLRLLELAYSEASLSLIPD